MNDTGKISNSKDRVAHWSQKLLDLSLRNRLLNVRDTRHIIPLVCSDVTVLENKIASSEAISLNSSFLASSLSPTETDKRLLGVYRQAKSDLEEGGVNTLFLSIGFLEWKVSEKEEKSYLAPILLIPIRIQRKTIAEGFRISRIDEDAIINETLLELLRSQFNIVIPNLSPLPLDDSGVDVEKVFASVHDAIGMMNGWKVREEACIGLFSFSKFTMWNDMTSRIDELKASPIVNHLITGSGIFDDGIEVFDAKDVRKHIDYSRLYCPMSADSSQLAAVLYSEKGKNFVLHGPPGTGKSQTITNIIAHNLAIGKKVLFVSEKKAALDVVHKRLSSIGLRPFCLELHSNKSGKKEVLSQFAEALGVPACNEARGWNTTVAMLEQLRKELNGYVESLHKVYPNGLTAYACFSRFLNKRKMPDGLAAQISCLTQTREELEACKLSVIDFANAWQETNKEVVDAFRFIKPCVWCPSIEKELLSSLQSLYDNLRQLASYVSFEVKKNRDSFFLIKKIKDFLLVKKFVGIKSLSGAPITIADLEKFIDCGEDIECGNVDLVNLISSYKSSVLKCSKFTDYFSVWRNPIDIFATLENAIEKISSLRGALHYLSAKEVVDKNGLSQFASAMENGAIEIDDARETFLDLYYKTMLEMILSDSPILCNFSGRSHEERIAKFKELDSKYIEYSKQMIFAKLASRLPILGSVKYSKGTEIGLLKRECEKKMRHKPIRQLLTQIPNLATVLKPCFLMSPLSVAQYLPADTAQFDLIVFDEASQIPVWDAIGVIARGKQLIVVGDPKQMPPTNFFQKGESKDVDEEEDEIADMESILDECIASGIYSSYLNWHYRSKHESLISFSNHYYYEDRLFTFPAAKNTSRLGVRFEFVDRGVYDRKASRTNRAEAEALVKYIFRNLEDSSHKKRSIGVVTFSQAQKDLIEDLIETERINHPDLEMYFSDQNEEPLFVKNLENVQGDERDVILFSICYAPDADGKFAMNFGPLNRQGGERRLNVAITRAKEQVVVFSSIHSEQIDLNRTQATGAEHLKEFLEYAERGVRVKAKSFAEEKSEELIDIIADILTSHGYRYERNVGSSDYKIDLAVYNPDGSGNFILAIECDGSSYATQKTTRDRDQLRASVLGALGWHTYRVWTADWVFDRVSAEKRLLEYIEKIKLLPLNS